MEEWIHRIDLGTTKDGGHNYHNSSSDSHSTKEMNPAVPFTPKEITEATIE